MNIKELRRAARGRAAHLLPALCRVLPEKWGRAACAGLGRLGHATVARDRRLARANLARVHPDWTEADVKAAARRVFEEMGRNAYDVVRYPDLSPERRRKLVRLEGRAHLERALAAGRGAVVVSGHLGAFELLAAALVQEGFPLRPLVRPLREPRLEALLARHRARMGVRPFPGPRLPLSAWRYVREGGFLGLVMDHRVKQGGVEVRFLGLPTRMAEGPARIARALGCPVLCAGISRLSDHRHRARVSPPIDPASFPSARSLTQTLASRLDAFIREAPEQWMWTHPRWADGVAAPRDAASAPHPENACAPV